MAKFVIDRSRWRCGKEQPQGRGPMHRLEHGHGQGGAALMNEHGMLCCLGFVAEQLGCPVAAIDRCGTPEDVSLDALEALEGVLLVLTKQGEWGKLVANHTELADEAMDINDNGTIPQALREASQPDLFAKHGHQLEFVGEYNPEYLA